MSTAASEALFRQVLIDNDIPESRIEELVVQQGMSMQQVVEYFGEQGMLDEPCEEYSQYEIEKANEKLLNPEN